MKICTSCGENKTYTDYSKARYGKGGVAAKCKECFKILYKMRVEDDPDYVRNVKYKSRYGITIDDYNRMLEDQDHKCKICLAGEERGRLHVDHCHETGKIRGLLCHQCNNGLGCFHDSDSLLEHAIEYIREIEE